MPMTDFIFVATTLGFFALAIAYNAAAIPLAAFGFVTPLIAAATMAGSSLLVTLNALRLASGRTAPWA